MDYQKLDHGGALKLFRPLARGKHHVSFVQLQVCTCRYVLSFIDTMLRKSVNKKKRIYRTFILTTIQTISMKQNIAQIRRIPITNIFNVFKGMHQFTYLPSLSSYLDCDRVNTPLKEVNNTFRPISANHLSHNKTDN